MVKISPIISNLKLDFKNLGKIQKTKPYISNPKTTTVGLVGATGILISTFLKDYRKTVENENYFQFKIDKQTGKHYNPDEFQNAAGMNLYLGKDVLVTAPTGTGKTAIAEYVITKNLKEGKKTFYTTPLKALSNEKFLNFSKTYGEENVGLITGDTSIRPEAPIIIMTTEVYRNMADTEESNFDEETKKGLPSDLKTVIFDELQYLGDVDRGGIWEKSIMSTPKDVQILSLSATIGNNVEINDWIARTKKRKSIFVTPDKTYIPNHNNKDETILINVPPEKRHVPLTFEIIHAAPEIKLPRGGTKKEKLLAKQNEARKAQSVCAEPKDDIYKTITSKLKSEDKLPAIYFVFSRKECRHLLKYLSTESEILTNKEEQAEIEKIVSRYKKMGKFLGLSLNLDALKKGYAIHNAGLLPVQKRLVEELFEKKLVKVVLATDTLSAGINMPAKTVVISSPRVPTSTPDGQMDGKRESSPNEHHQRAGRAGRRGIDTHGYCYCISCNPEQTKVYNKLIESPSNPLCSNLELDYSFIANYIANFTDQRELEYMLSKSFYVYDKGQVNEEKLSKLIDTYNVKKSILIKDNYIDNNGKLTVKGHLIKHINGYEQIPLINMLTNGSLVTLNPVQLAGIIGGIANIEYNTKGKFPEKPFEVKIKSDSNFENACEKIYQEIKSFEQKSSMIHPDRELKLNPKSIEHLYNWADSCSKCGDAKHNWEELFTNGAKFSTDEGSMFKEITKTTDLLKQLIDVSKIGFKISESYGEKAYYKYLAETLQQSLDLIQKGANIFEL